MKFSQKQKRNPSGLTGELLLHKMKKVHIPLQEWGNSLLDIKEDSSILDIGCGCGENVRRCLLVASKGKVIGIDPSKLCCHKSKRLNRKEIKEGRCEIYNDTALSMEFDNESFDIITGYCTITFWGDYEKVFTKIYNYLKPNGVFMICDYGRYDVNDMMEYAKKVPFKSVENIKAEPNFNAILCMK